MPALAPHCCHVGSFVCIGLGVVALLAVIDVAIVIAGGGFVEGGELANAFAGSADLHTPWTRSTPIAKYLRQLALLIIPS